MFDLFIEVNLKVFLVLFLYGMIMGKIRQVVVGHMMARSANGLLVNLLNLVGTPVHEIGHLLMGLLFGYKITEVCLYRTIRQAAASDQKLGYVKMSHRKGGFLRELWMDIGGFFVGIGPLLSGPAVILGLFCLLPREVRTWVQGIFRGELFTKGAEITGVTGVTGVTEGAEITGVIGGVRVLQQSIAALGTGNIALLILYLVAVLGIALNMELSTADLKMAVKGFCMLELLTLAASVIVVSM